MFAAWGMTWETVSYGDARIARTWPPWNTSTQRESG